MPSFFSSTGTCRAAARQAPLFFLRRSGVPPPRRPNRDFEQAGLEFERQDAPHRIVDIGLGDQPGLERLGQRVKAMPSGKFMSTPALSPARGGVHGIGLDAR